MKENKTHAQEIADWICSLRYEGIPERVLKKARYQILNMLAAAHAGGMSEGGKIILKTAKEWGTPGRCTIVPTGEKITVHHAAFVNTALSMAYDFDDYLYMGHTCHSSVFVPLAIAQDRGLSAKEAILAQVISNEVEGRIGAAVLIGPHNGQMWSFIHQIGASSAAAKLLKLNFNETVNAIGISMYQPNFALWPGFMGAQSKLLTASIPTLTGIISAELARNGFTGSPAILEHPSGFYSHFSYWPLLNMVSGFGKSWVTDSLSFKKYPGCAYIDTTIDALLMVMERYKEDSGRRLTPDAIDGVTVEASLLTVGMEGVSLQFLDENELSPVNINFSIPLNVAITILSGRLSAAELGQEYLNKNRGDILSLAKKVELKHNWSMSLGLLKAMDEGAHLSRALAEVPLRKLRQIRRSIIRETGSAIKITPKEIIRMLRETKREERLILRKMLRQRLFPSKRDPGFQLGEIDFDKFRMPFAARVTLKLKDGRALQAQQDIPYGAPGQEGGFEVVKEKFRENALRLLPKEKVERTIELVESFESIKSLEELMSTCCL